MPPAPLTFSMMICWPSSSDIGGAMMRAATSIGPPAGNGTTMVMVRTGQACAQAGTACVSSATMTAHTNVRRIGGLPKTGEPTLARPAGCSLRRCSAADRRDQRSNPAVQAPQYGSLLDETLGAAIGKHHGDDQPAAQARSGQVVVQPQLGVGPVELVGLVADREIEPFESALDRAAQKLVQMRAAGTEARDFAVVIARQHEIVGVAEAQP